MQKFDFVQDLETEEKKETLLGTNPKIVANLEMYAKDGVKTQVLNLILIEEDP